MVKQNNSYSGIGINNQTYVDAYIRNVEEFRRSIENSLLPIVSFFIAKNEQLEPKSKLIMPVSVLADNKRYLQSLGKEYFKRDFDFIASDTERLKIYDVISNVIYRVKKTYQYGYCDFMDALFKYPELLNYITLPAHIVRNAKRNVVDYNHALPKIIEDAPNIYPHEEKKVNFTKSASTSSTLFDKVSSDGMLTKPVFDVAVHNKFPTPIHLYAYVLSDIKKSVDFEILKLYDYLCENENLTIHSNKLIKIYEELKYIGEVEYTKVPFKTKVLPANDLTKMTVEDICLDELSANISRGIDAKVLLGKDLIAFMNHPEGKELQEVFGKGYYPELQALVHQYKR